MTIKELHFKLKELGVPEEKYFLHGLYGSTDDNDKISLLIKRVNFNLIYEVYYKEKGEKYSVKEFDSEDSACQYLLRVLKRNKEIEDKYLH